MSAPAAAGYPITLPRPAARAWLRGHGLEYVRLPRSLDEPYTLQTPDGRWFVIEALITGGFKIAAWEPPVDAAGAPVATVFCPTCGRPLRTAHSDAAVWACVSCDVGYSKATMEVQA